jgi:chemotaxis protein CheY-P-specific phosphatase CheC
VNRLRLLSERSLQRAGETLAVLLGHPVRLAVSEVGIIPLRDLAQLGEAAGGIVGGARFEITGEGRGQMMIVFPLPTLARMLEALLGRSAEGTALGPAERSAVQEVGNIVVSSFLNGVSDLLNKRLLPTPPRFQYGPMRDLVGEVVAALGPDTQTVLLVQAVFQDERGQVLGRFYVVPRVPALEEWLGGPEPRGEGRA